MYETFTDSVGELYRAMRREYGRCEGRVYRDTADSTKAIGWVFVKRMQYEDSPDTYLRRVWVTLHDAPATRTVEYHFHEMAS